MGLQWPSHAHPTGFSSFETQARSLRYRALGAACRDRTIRHLLLAHHNDDHAESVLMKVAAAGEHIWSIRPMGDSELNIPDCWSCHGLHESGQREFQATLIENALKKKNQYRGWQDVRPKLHSQLPDLQCEDGGVKIYRPLMHFSKRELEETCRKHHVEWVEDETNQDVTMTQRNAIRSLLQNQRLPRALSKESLLGLAQKIAKKIKGYETHTETFLRRIQIISLDLRSGRLVVGLPRQSGSSKLTPEIYKKDRLSVLRTRATMLLTRLLSLVTPLNYVQQSKVHSVAEIVFPDLLGSDAETHRTVPPSLKFNIGGVLVQRIKAPAESSGDCIHSRSCFGLDRDFVWSFTREPYRRSISPHIIIPSFQQIGPPESNRQSRSHEAAAHTASGPSWQFWDGRYWIRVSNHTGADVIVRPLRKSDLHSIHNTVSPSQFKEFTGELRMAAPHDARWTLPVIAETGGLERPLALPTLHCKLDLTPVGLLWEIRYKYIHLEHAIDTSSIIR